ncbi:MAG: metallophosphoesterase [Clostridia bacterium]|nr:metallophosphoesterase [Clostridia bacterium]
MKVFALSDLHLSFESDKPMNVFGENWDNYENRIIENWNSVVGVEDLVIIAGDISWAISIENTKKDFEFIDKLNGKKVIIRGNHDYWWKAIGVVRDWIPNTIKAIQNDAIDFGDVIICGSRGWLIHEREKQPSADDLKMINRELIRIEMSFKKAIEIKGDSNKEIICVLHYPPFNSYLDESEFTNLIEQYKIKKVVFGHLHGKNKYPNGVIELNGVKYYLSSCDRVDFTPIQIK